MTLLETALLETAPLETAPLETAPLDPDPRECASSEPDSMAQLADPANVRFHAMGSDGHIIVASDQPDLPDLARVRVDDLERRWSRFDPTSDVSELNRHPGHWVDVCPETVELVRRSVEAYRMSGGSFDPTVAGDVIRAGYDRSFPDLADRSSGGHSAWTTGCDQIEIADRAVRLPTGTGFDPGGIGKGLAADIVVSDLLRAGADGVCVNLGGDLRVAGVTPAGGGWTIAIETPEGGRNPIAVVGLADGAAATSSTLRRRWVADGENRHHLIDPFTGRPSETDLVSATVIASRAWEAEVLATAVLLRGSQRGLAILGGTGAVALTVGRDRRIATSPGFERFVSGPIPEVCP